MRIDCVSISRYAEFLVVGFKNKEAASTGEMSRFETVMLSTRENLTALAEVAVPRELFAVILDRIQRFGVPPPLLQRSLALANAATPTVEETSAGTVRLNAANGRSR